MTVLTEDRELAATLGGARLAKAETLSVTRALRRPAGRWDAKEDADEGRDGLGLLVIEGTLVRRVGMGQRFGAELLSDGDILQPAEHDGEAASLPFEATWRVLAPLHLAVLDLHWMKRMSPFPEVFAELSRRLTRRSRRLASLLAITQHHRLDVRLHLFFWELADRYGRVTPDGVRIEIPLTHTLISHLVGARRPSVTGALHRLDEQGLVRRDKRTWVLLGSPPSVRDEFAAADAIG